MIFLLYVRKLKNWFTYLGEFYSFLWGKQADEP